MVRRDDVDVGVLLTVEYEQLKAEQAQRIGTRDNLIYATLVSIGGVLIGAHQAESPSLLLLLPPGCVILGWTYLINDEKISAIGRYLRLDLAPRLTTLAGSAQPLFGWEVEHRSDPHRRSRKIIQLGADLLTFCAPGLVAIAACLLLADGSILIAAIVTAEIALILILATQIVVNSDLSRDRSWSASDADIVSVPRDAGPRAGGAAE